MHRILLAGGLVVALLAGLAPSTMGLRTAAAASAPSPQATAEAPTVHQRHLEQLLAGLLPAAPATPPATPISPAILQQELTSTDGAQGDWLGNAVAISGDTMVVGAPFSNIDTGAVYVYVRSGTSWILQQELTASDAAHGDWFGFSVAISGNTIVVGAVARNANAGAVYVFGLGGAAWVQQQELTPVDTPAGGFFGYSVALDGPTLVVGSMGANSGKGAAYVFTDAGDTWTQQQELTAADGAAHDGLGYAVSISGPTLVVGAWARNNGAGAAYVYALSGTTWTQQQELTAPDAAPDDQFGSSVAVSGATVVVGAGNKNNAAGAAYVYALSGTAWTQQQELTAGDGTPQDGFGASVSLNGNTLVVGAAGQNKGTGAAYLFARNGAAWAQRLILTAAGGSPGDGLGNAVSLGEGAVAVGAATTANQKGAAYVFVPNPTVAGADALLAG